MKGNDNILPELSDKERCLTPADMFVSEKFQTFLSLYNRRNQTNVQVQDILNDFDLATEVYDFARECKVPGGTIMRIIGDIHSLAHEVLGEVKERHSDRILPENEMVERLYELGVDIEEIRDSIETSNIAMGYGKVLARAGILKKGEKYNLPLPEITEAKMKELESAFSNFKYDTLFIDDARMTELETYMVHAPSTKHGKSEQTIDHVAHSLPIENGGLAEIEELAGEDVNDPETMLTLFSDVREIQPLPDRKVRILAFRSALDSKTLEGMRQHSGKSLQGALPGTAGEAKSLGLGTYFRLTRYLKATNPELAYKLNKVYIYMNHGNPEEYVCETLLNNIDMDGRAIVISGDNLGKRYGIKWVNPVEQVQLRSIKLGLYI